MGDNIKEFDLVRSNTDVNVLGWLDGAVAHPNTGAATLKKKGDYVLLGIKQTPNHYDWPENAAISQIEFFPNANENQTERLGIWTPNADLPSNFAFSVAPNEHGSDYFDQVRMTDNEDRGDGTREDKLWFKVTVSGDKGPWSKDPELINKTGG